MSGESYLNGRVTLHAGDMLAVLDTLPDNSVDSVVCDPPYHLHSIVKRFAKTGRTESTRSSSGPHQRTATGFMGKQWDGGDIAFQASTWAKVLRVLKPGGHILAFSSSRTFGRMSVAIEDAGFITQPMIGWIFESGFPKAHRVKAEGYEGYRYGGQAMKPALEPIYLGQKPFSESTGTANVLRWGVGGLNIDACRVQANGSRPNLERRADAALDDSRTTYGAGLNGSRAVGSTDLGRWPANLIHDGSDEAIAAFPERVVNTPGGPSSHTGTFNGGWQPTQAIARENEGSAARFFYSAKADSDDRLGSKHPTVKPLDLVQYLVRLVTPPKVRELVCQACYNPPGKATGGTNVRQDVPPVQGAVSEQAQCDDLLLGGVSARGGSNPSNPMQDVRRPDTSGEAGVLLPGMSSAEHEGSKDPNAAPMQAVRRDIHAEEGRGADILLSQVRGDRIRAGEAQEDEDGSRLHRDASAGEPDGVKAGLRDGAPAGHGAAPGASAAGGRSCASHQRHSGRQQDRKSSGDAEVGARPAPETDNLVSDPVSVLRGDAEAVQHCPQCGGPLVYRERPGVVLDCFAGTGTTGEAAFREGMSAVLIEREPEYQADIRRRMALCLAGSDERRRAIAKAKANPDDLNGTLFASVAPMAAE